MFPNRIQVCGFDLCFDELLHELRDEAVMLPLGLNCQVDEAEGVKNGFPRMGGKLVNGNELLHAPSLLV